MKESFRTLKFLLEIKPSSYFCIYYIIETHFSNILRDVKVNLIT